MTINLGILKSLNFWKKLFLVLTVIAAAAWLLLDKPSLEPLTVIAGGITGLLEGTSRTRANKKLGLLIVGVGLLLFAWGAVRAFQIAKPSATTTEVSQLNERGLDAYNKGQYREALNYYQQALLIAQEKGDWAKKGAMLNNIGTVYKSQGQYDQALEYFQQALVIAREKGDRAGEGSTLNNIGLVYQSQGQYDQALEYYQQALVIVREVGDRAGEGTTLNNIGVVYDSQGQ